MIDLYTGIGFILGITSSLHCIGMCGPIALAIPLDRSSTGKIVQGLIVYHLGRISIYGILGVIIGLIGMSIQLFGWLQGLSILSGVVLILFAWKKYLPLHYFTASSGFPSFFSRAMASLHPRQGPYKLLLLGMLNGLLPCGMVFAALANAILSGDVVNSAVAMLAFGLGTLPALFIFSMVFKKTKVSFNSNWIAVILTTLGLLIILRGLNLGIPLISPELKQQDQHCDVKMRCCH